MEADGHAELLDGAPQRLHLGIVNVAAVNRAWVADHGHGAALANRAPGLGHLAELEVADLDDGLVRRVGGAAQELRRELLERLVEVALPEAVGLHRVEVRVHDLEAVLHRDSSSRWLRPPGSA